MHRPLDNYFGSVYFHIGFFRPSGVQEAGCIDIYRSLNCVLV